MDNKKKKPAGWWNYEHCFEEAKKYSSLKEFSKNSPTAARISSKNKWNQDYTWMQKRRMPNGWWNYEHCFEEAKKYKTWHEFETKSAACAHAARKHGWSKEYTWLDKYHKRVAQYTLDGKFIRLWDNPEQAGKSFTNLVNAAGAIGQCCKLKKKRRHAHGFRWLYEQDMERANEIFASLPINHRTKPYTEEEVREIAGKYATLKEFREKEPNFLAAAYRLKILDDLSFERIANPYRDNVFCVYAYEFELTNSVYVGLTCHKTERDWSHRNKNKNSKKEKSAVFMHAEKNNIEIPAPKYIKENLSHEDALIYEDKLKIEYANNGWNILNRAKTGINSGSIGGIGKISNAEIKAAASKCEFIDEFRTRFKKLYATAVRRSIVSKLGLKYRYTPDGTFTEEVCYNIAKKCRCDNDMRKIAKGASRASYLNGWQNQYWWFTKNNVKPVVKCCGFRMKIYNSVQNCCDEIGWNYERFLNFMKAGKKIDGAFYHYLDTSDIDYMIPDFEHRLAI